MKPAFFRVTAVLFAFATLAPMLSGQIASSGLPAFAWNDTVPFKIVREAVPARPFSVVGPRGAILGQQDGSFEGWVFPLKLFRNFRIRAEMQDYPVPIDVNEQAAVIEVRPDHTTITFAHANFTVREVIFAPHDAPDGAGPLAFFQIDAVRPLTLTFEFAPEMKRMWPAPSSDHTDAEWTTGFSNGFYVLRLNFPDQAAAIAMPGAGPGILAPYQERARTYPAQFVLHFDPKLDANKLFPLLVTTSEAPAASAGGELAAKLDTLSRSFRSLFESNADYSRRFLADDVSIETPDATFNDAFQWAEIAIDHLQVQTAPGHKETALVAGFDGSGDSARPGFGWFFGRDSLWTLYAVDSYGDFQLTRNQLDFLIRRQGPEGQIIHEWSQTAGIVDWKSLPYEFAAADATPLFLMAVNDYLQISGDVEFIRSRWGALEKAWAFERSHDADGDGIYENIAGSGWVESWPPGLPHQEIYLAALDRQASTAFARLAQAAGHVEAAQDADGRAAHIAQQIEKEYFLPEADFYAFSRSADGSLDKSPTIYPAVAAWDGTFNLAHSAGMLDRWASAEFSTDWGTRDLSPSVSFYDPISYHQGSVWPLFTGWAALSEYRNGRALSAYSHLMQNADLTWSQDLGAVTELLSGEFFRWFGRSTAHQLWSSAMVVTPTLRGMFGVEWHAADSALTVTPNLPASWDEVRISRLPIANSRVDLTMRRNGTYLSIRSSGASGLRLRSHALGARNRSGELQIPLPPVEVGLGHGLPAPGSTAAQLKVIDQQFTQHALRLILSAPANSMQTLFLRINGPRLHPRIEGADLDSGKNQLRVQFPSGAGFVEKEVSVRW